MTVDVRTGRPIFYECPECHEQVRGLMNGRCKSCEQQEQARQRMWADMEAGSFKMSDIS